MIITLNFNWVWIPFPNWHTYGAYQSIKMLMTDLCGVGVHYNYLIQLYL